MPNAINPETTIRALEAVALVVRSSSGHGDPDRQARTIAVLEHVATLTQALGIAAVDLALAAVREAMIEPLDPSTIGWNPFRFFEVEDKETSWTRWLAAILSPESMPELSCLVWRSLCDAVVAQGREPRICVDAERGVSPHWTSGCKLRRT